MLEKYKQLALQWFSYAMFYFCRVNFSLIAPLLMALLGFSLTDISIITSGLLGAYAIGQFINGQINEKYSKTSKFLGMIGSSFLTFLMAFITSPMIMAIVWSLNGFFQSMGWSASVKMTANWFKEKERGKAAGILGTSYQIGNVLAWIVTAFALSLGWQAGFIIPAILLGISGIIFKMKAVQSPENKGLPSIEGRKEKGDSYLGLKQCLRSAVMNWRVWAVAFGGLCLNIVRYGFLVWAPVMIYQLDPNIMTTSLKVLMFPIAGSLGALTMGLLEKRKKNISKLGVAFLLFLTGTMLAYPYITNVLLSVLTLGLIGFFLYGAHMLIVARLPMMLGTRKVSAGTTGLIDGFAYLGSFLTSAITAILVTTGGWGLGLAFWTLGALGATLSLGTLWTYKRKKTKYE